MFTCVSVALRPLTVLLPLLGCGTVPTLPSLPALSTLQPLERIGRVVNERFLWRTWGGYVGERRHLGLPPFFRAAVILSAVAVAHVIKSKVLDLVSGPAVGAVGAVLLLVKGGVVEAEQVIFTVPLRLGLGRPETGPRTQQRSNVCSCRS